MGDFANYIYGEPGCWCVSILDYGATGVTVMHETRIRHSPPWERSSMVELRRAKNRPNDF